MTQFAVSPGLGHTDRELVGGKMSGKSFDFKKIVSQWQESQNYRDLNWSGTFDDYLEIVKKDPKVTRNAFQRMYDMVMERVQKSTPMLKRKSFATSFLMMLKMTGKTLFSGSTFRS